MVRFVGGAALRLLQTFLYAIEFCCAAIILSLYSYFLSVLADRNLPISSWKKAVEGISGAATLYLIFAVLLTCCLGGISFFAFIAIVLDVLFCGAFVALAVMTRQGAHSCSGYVNTPLGNGPSSSKNAYGTNGFGSGNGKNVTFAVSLGTACRMNSACFAVSILGAILFLVSALVQIALARHHRKEKRFGPSPANNYTSGTSRRRFWQRKPKDTRDAELATVGAGGLAATHYQNDYRPSHETGYTGSTVAAPTAAAYDKQGNAVPATGGYDNTRTAATNY